MSTDNSFAKTETMRRWIHRYNTHVDYIGEPTTICLHECTRRYGGPEEGGWYYQQGWPVNTVCVFSKKQAIREAIKLEAKALEELGPQQDNLGWSAWRVTFSNDYAKAYPEERPYYC